MGYISHIYPLNKYVMLGFQQDDLTGMFIMYNLAEMALKYPNWDTHTIQMLISSIVYAGII